MALRRRRLTSRQLTFLTMALGAEAALYLIFIAPTTPTPRELIETQVLQSPATADELNELRARLAIEHFTRDRKRPPSSLQALVPHYLAQVPRSAESGDPLHFAIKGDSALIGAQALQTLQAHQNAGSADAAQLQIEPQPLLAAAPESNDPGEYAAVGLRDPFQPYEYALKEGDADDERPALERYELSQLKLKAIVASGELSYATLEDTTGRGFIVRKGAIIGVNRGEVTEILSDKITIVERSTDRAGRTKINSVILKLRAKALPAGSARSRR